MSNTDFSYRLQRARTEPFEIVQFLSNNGTSAKIHSINSGNIYTVKLNSCTCKDFRQHRLICKHMMFLRLSTGRHLSLNIEVCGVKRFCDSEVDYDRNYNDDEYFIDDDDDDEDDDNDDQNEFIPRYQKYYSGKATGLGFTNLYPYEICGRLHGVSPKTGRPTNRKKTVLVNASGFQDAKSAAQSMSIMPPYTSVRLINTCPSVGQLNYIHGLGIPYPALVNSADISALLTRYQDRDDEITPFGLFQFATNLRVQVSYFASPRIVYAYIWNRIPESQRPTLFCYAVFCRELSTLLGNTIRTYKDSVFTSFAPTPTHLKYFLNLRTLYNLNKRSSAYKAAVAHIRSHGLLT